MLEKFYAYSENIIDSGSRYIPVALPLFFSRAITSFYPNEPLKNRLLEGVLFAAVGTLNEYLISTDKLKSYFLSFLPLAFSLTYKNLNLPTGNKIVAATTTTAIAGLILYNDLQKHLIAPAITYAIGNSLKLPTNVKATLISASITEEICLNLGIYDKHYLSSFFSTKVIAEAFQARFTKIFLLDGNIIGAIGGWLLAQNEDQILDYITPRKFYKDSYALLCRYIDPGELDVRIEYSFLVSASFATSIGFYGNHFITTEQRFTNSLARVMPHNDGQFSIMKRLLIDYIKVAGYYMFIRSFAEFVQTLKGKGDFRFAEEKFLKDNLLQEHNFLISTKANFTATDYLGNIASLVEEIDSMSYQLMFSLPKLLIMTSINKEIILGLAAIMTMDVAYSYSIEYLNDLRQSYNDNFQLNNSNFDKMTKHDTSKASLVLQNDLLSYTRDRWLELHNNKTINQLKGDLIGTIQNYCGWIYHTAILYSSYKYLAAKLVLNEVIKAEQIFLYVRVLESITDVLFFNTKHQSNFIKVNAAIKKLKDLSDLLHSVPKYDVRFQIDDQADALKIHDLVFTRGDAERNTTLTTNELTLEKGEVYAVTGANGSGKSSLLTLLYYILNEILDQSFSNVKGHLTYPFGEIKIITQKDFCLAQVSLFELLIAPKKIANLTTDEQSKLRSKVDLLIKDLKINNNGQASGLVMQLDTIKDDWCNELSGGQIKKLAFGKLTLMECPSIVILDETFAPLDQASKKHMMASIKADNCLSKALILVVSHDDIIGIKAKNLTCAESFYTKELQVTNGTVVVNDLCVREFITDESYLHVNNVCGLANSLESYWLELCY